MNEWPDVKRKPPSITSQSGESLMRHFPALLDYGEGAIVTITAGRHSR
jgi:hypothetical protein